MNRFCAVPWNELYITSNGTYGMCCMEDQDANDHRISVEQPIEFHWNSDYLKKTRSDFVNGQNLPQCRHCWQEEEADKVSGRMRRNQQYYGKANLHTDDPLLTDTLSKTMADGSTTKEIEGLFFSVGDLCQLRCIDCSPSYSRSILKDYQKLGWRVNDKSRRSIRIQDLSHDPEKHNQYLWQRVREAGNSVRWIRVSGGEPSLSRDLLSFLEWYAEQGHADHTTIFIATNAVNVKEEFINALKPFQLVKLELSVDGFGALDEYLRYPTDWDKKVDIMDRLIESFPGCVVHTTAYSFNVEGLEKLIPWVETKDVLHSIQCLTYPTELDLRHLPDSYKKEMIDILSQWSSESDYKVSDNYRQGDYRGNCINGILNRLRQPGDPVLWEKAKKIAGAYDTIRPVSLKTLLPKLSNYL